MFPIAFQENITRLLGPEGGARLLAALNDEAAPVSVRFNPLKGGAAAKAGLPVAEPVPWCADGFYLAERPQFTSDPLLHAGAYYVQEASSMFIAQAFKQIDFAPRRVLDLCAAPGGKSTLWRALLPDDALLVANEPIRPRANILAENLAKWGHPNVIVSNAYADGFAPLHSFFDVIAADVPCSGEGMFRKDRAAREEWTDGSPSACTARQWDIVSTVWPALRQGGYLVYSTCTFNREENEDIVWRIMKELGAEPVPIDCPAEWNIEGDLKEAMHVYLRGDALVATLDRKALSSDAKKKYSGKKAGSAVISVTIHTPELKTLRASGNAIVDMSGFRVDQECKFVSLQVNSTSDVSVSGRCETLDVTALNSAKLRLEGSAVTLNLKAGCREIHADGLSVNDAAVTGSNACKAELNVSDNLSLDLKGGCQIVFAGKPVIDIVNIQNSSVSHSQL